MEKNGCVATLFLSASLDGTVTRLLPELAFVPMKRPGSDFGAVVIEVASRGEASLEDLGRLTKRLKGETPVVALSRSADPDRMARILTTGVYDCVPLPLDVPRLHNALRRAVEHGALRRALRERNPSSAAPPGLPTLELAGLERLAIEAALRETSMNVEAAAKLLGLARSTLYRRVPHLVQGATASDDAVRPAPALRRRRTSRPTA
jgi:DNA-binding NtrC family response regulator